MSPASMQVVRFADVRTLEDLVTYVHRAKRADPDGAARLVGHGDVLAVYVSPVHDGGAPTVLGLRTLLLGTPSDLDTTVLLAALTDRFPRALAGGPAGREGGDVAELPVPPVEAAGVSWAGVRPPRRGWDAVGVVEATILTERAEAGIAEIAQGAPAGSGALAVASLRAQVWGRPLVDSLPGLPAGVAFAAHALGFCADDEPAAVYRTGTWWRVTSRFGHVLARRPSLL